MTKDNKPIRYEIQIPPNLLQDVKKYAKNNGRSINGAIKTLLKLGLNK